MSITRRQFLAQSGRVAAGFFLLPGFARVFATSPSFHFPVEPRERVAVAAYPFREFIAGWKGWDGNSPGPIPESRRMEYKHFAAHVAEKFGVRKIEPWSRLFPRTDPEYVAEFRAALDHAGSAVVDIAVDGDHSQYSPDAAEREQAFEFSKKWVDIGAALGSPSIRTHIADSKTATPSVPLAAETLRKVAEYGASKNLVVHLENDNPVSEDPFFIVKVIERVNSPWLRALPDFGNSLAAHDEEFAERAMDAMFAHAYGICHVKDGEENEQGKMVHVDLPRVFSILKKHGYKGYCSIEFDRPGDPYEATARLIAETVKFLS
jgi:sugar phosphate isomerase/epimerase